MIRGFWYDCAKKKIFLRHKKICPPRNLWIGATVQYTFWMCSNIYLNEMKYSVIRRHPLQEVIFITPSSMSRVHLKLILQYTIEYAHIYTWTIDEVCRIVFQDEISHGLPKTIFFLFIVFQFDIGGAFPGKNREKKTWITYEPFRIYWQIINNILLFYLSVLFKCFILLLQQ